jgi:ferredoxin
MEKDFAVAYVNPVPKEHEEAAKEAASNCPVEAILIS